MEIFLGFVVLFWLLSSLFSSFSLFLVLLLLSFSLVKRFSSHNVLLLSDTMGKRSFKTGKWVKGFGLGGKEKGWGMAG